jgi:hypothetical protein
MFWSIILALFCFCVFVIIALILIKLGAIFFGKKLHFTCDKCGRFRYVTLSVYLFKLKGKCKCGQTLKVFEFKEG